jgi:hypothetical protein
MLGRHSAELLSRLETVAIDGCVIVSWGQLLMWYGQERVTVGIWRDLLDKWQEVIEASVMVEDKAVPLFVGRGDANVAFVYGEGVTSDGTWLEDLVDLSQGRGRK